MEQISRIGLDTSKHFFQLHGVNAAEKVVLRKKLRRKEMVAFFKALAPTVIGIEAELAIRRMRTGYPVRFRPAEGGVRLEGVVLECDPDGRATSIEALRLPFP